MADYKEMYLKMMRATETAIRVLVKAQQECEELYLQEDEPELTLLQFPTEENGVEKSRSGSETIDKD